MPCFARFFGFGAGKIWYKELSDGTPENEGEYSYTTHASGLARERRRAGQCTWPAALVGCSLRSSSAGKRQWSEQLKSGTVRTEADWRLLPLEDFT